MTVLSERKTSAAISLFVLPSATGSRIFCSCAVSCANSSVYALVAMRRAFEHLLGDGRMQGFPAADGLERGHEVPGTNLLEQVAAGASDDARHGLFVWVAREHDHADLGVLGADLAAGLDAGAIEADIHC